jgi:hypothetical protein
MTDTTNKAIETTVDTSAMTLTLSFSNGQTLTLDATVLTSDVQAQATMHGLRQKLNDAAAISRNPDTGRSATVDDKYNAVREVYDRLLSGQWNKSRDGGTGSGAGGLLFRALCKMYADKTPEQIRTFLEKKDAKQQAALRAVPAIVAIIDELRAAQAKSGGTDADAMLSELDDAVMG